MSDAGLGCRGQKLCASMVLPCVTKAKQFYPSSHLIGSLEIPSAFHCSSSSYPTHSPFELCSCTSTLVCFHTVPDSWATHTELHQHQTLDANQGGNNTPESCQPTSHPMPALWGIKRCPQPQVWGFFSCRLFRVLEAFTFILFTSDFNWVSQ